MTAWPAERTDRAIQIAIIAILALGSWLILRPFLSLLVFSSVIAVSVWPAYLKILGILRNRRAAASSVACLGVVLMVVVPVMLVMTSFVDAVAWIFKLLEKWSSGGLPALPDFIADVPVLGGLMMDYWHELVANPQAMQDFVGWLADPMRNFIVAAGRALGIGLFQAVIGVLLLFFLFRDGEFLREKLLHAANRIGGIYASELLTIVRRTTTGVVVSIIGAGLAQAMVATIGFAIAGIPQPFILGALTFVLSLVPWGPVLVWGGAAFWLLQHGQTGWFVFMLLYGWLCISSVDNVLKPFLISRTSQLPFVLTVIGVVGGILAFGVVGLFIGPTLLALTSNMSQHWLAHRIPPVATDNPDKGTLA